MLPIRWNSFGLIERTRLVPSASGLPAHGSATAATRPSNQTNNTTTTRIGPPDLTPSPTRINDFPTVWRATLTEDYALWTQHSLVFQWFLLGEVNMRCRLNVLYPPPVEYARSDSPAFSVRAEKPVTSGPSVTLCHERGQSRAQPFLCGKGSGAVPVGLHLLPVTCPYVSPKNHETALVHAIEKSGV